MSVTVGTHSRIMRQTLQLSIDPLAYSLSLHPSPESPDTSSSSALTSPETSDEETIIYSVLCMYDFHSEDPGHLPFFKNEILDIVKQETTGWWAAMRRGGDAIGWIPQAFVTPLTEEMTERLWNVREELRVYEYEAEQLYESAPITRTTLFETEPESSPPTASVWPSRNDTYGQNSWQIDSLSPEFRRRPFAPPSPATPMPQPPPESVVRNKFSNKPTPPTPTAQDMLSSGAPSGRWLPPLSTPSDHLQGLGGDSNMSPESVKRRDEKIKKLTGSDEALAFHNAVLTQAIVPWYLKPRHTDELITDLEGKLVSGTRIALVEKLVCDSAPKDATRSAQDTAYRRMFLTTFRTFMSADDLFEMLAGFYHLSRPEDISETECEEWKEKCLLPTQRLVLTIFTMWLEDHRLLEEEPYIARRLTDFLQLISPGPNAITAQLIIQSIARLTFATQPSTQSPVTSRRRGRKRKPHKGDLLRLEPSDIAEQLALLEYKLYNKITPQECIAHAKPPPVKPGCYPKPTNLSAFCSTHDKLAAWVTSTILNNETLSRRADTVDFWIKVAEKCRNLNNFASMCAIVNALSSTVILRLHLTWAHVGRKNTLDTLLKYNEPTGNFSAYRNLQLQAEGPCVPFVGMYLTELVHIKDQYSDEDDRVSVTQRQRWYEVVMVMLRSQSKPFHFSENESTLTFISTNMRPLTSNKDWQSRFWTKSQEVQHAELQHADIRKGLEAAGF